MLDPLYLVFQTLLHKFKAVADMFLGDINWYMFGTLLSFAAILIIQLIRRKGKFDIMRIRLFLDHDIIFYFKTTLKNIKKKLS